MAQHIDLNDTTGYERHQCTSRMEGHKIYFECTKCDYVRIYNRMTRKWTVTGGNMYTLHSGMHAPVGINLATLTAN